MAKVTGPEPWGVETPLPGNEAAMRLPFPGPSAVAGGMTTAADAVETALGLIPRTAAVLDRVEALLDKVEHVVDRTNQVVDRAEDTTRRGAAVLQTAEIVSRDAGRSVDGAAGVLDRVDASLQAWEPTLRRLAPSAKKFAEALAPGEVDAAISLVDRVPTVLRHVEDDVLPMLQQLDRVGPDLHDILEIVEDLRRVVTGLPGVGLLRRRGDEEPPPLEGGVHDDGAVNGNGRTNGRKVAAANGSTRNGRGRPTGG